MLFKNVLIYSIILKLIKLIRKALMNESIKILPNYKKFNSYIEDIKRGVSPIMLSGLTDSR